MKQRCQLRHRLTPTLLIVRERHGGRQVLMHGAEARAAPFRSQLGRDAHEPLHLWIGALELQNLHNALVRNELLEESVIRIRMHCGFSGRAGLVVCKRNAKSAALFRFKLMDVTAHAGRRAPACNQIRIEKRVVHARRWRVNPDRVLGRAHVGNSIWTIRATE